MKKMENDKIRLHEVEEKLLEEIINGARCGHLIDLDKVEAVYGPPISKGDLYELNVVVRKEYASLDKRPDRAIRELVLKEFYPGRNGFKQVEKCLKEIRNKQEKSSRVPETGMDRAEKALSNNGVRRDVEIYLRINENNLALEIVNDHAPELINQGSFRAAARLYSLVGLNDEADVAMIKYADRAKKNGNRARAQLIYERVAMRSD
jgi:hypothetical protein